MSQFEISGSRTGYRVEPRELTEQRTHGAAIPNVFHCNLPTRHERFKDRLLGVLRSASWWCRWKSKSALPKKFKPAISALAPIALGPGQAPQGASKPPTATKRLSWLEGLNRPLTWTLDAASFGAGWDDAAFLRYPPKPS